MVFTEAFRTSTLSTTTPTTTPTAAPAVEPVTNTVVTPPASPRVQPAPVDVFSTELPAPAAPVRASSGPAVDRVDEAREALKTAGKAAREKEEELKTILARVGGGLDPQQLQDLQETFREKHAEVYQAEEEAAAELARALKDPSLPPEVVAEGYAELAKSPSHAEAALKWASAAAGVPGSPYSTEQLEDIAADALDNSLAKILERSPNAEIAFDTVKDYLSPLIKAGGAGKGTLEAWQSLNDARVGNYDKLAELGGKWDSKLSRSIGIAAVAFGALSAGNSAKNGEYLAAIESLGNSGSRGIELLVGFTQSANRGAVAGTTPLGVAALRFSGALTAVASAAGFALDFKAFIDGKGGAYGVAAAGDLIAFAGGVSVATGIGAPVGAVLIAVGTVVSALGHYFGAKSEREKVEKELADLMREAGIPEDLVGPYSKNFEAVNALAQAGYSPQDIQAMVREDRFDLYAQNWESVKALADAGVRRDDLERFLHENPEEFQSPQNINALVGIGAAHGLEGAQLVDFAAHLREEASDGRWGAEITPFYESERLSSPDGETRRSTFRSFIEQGFPEAYDFAQEVSPETFSDTAQSEQQARQDVESAFKYGGAVNIALANALEEHKDDEAYLDAFVEALREHNGDDYVYQLYNDVAFYQPSAADAYQAAVERTE